MAFVFPAIAPGDMPLMGEGFTQEQDRGHYRRMANIERAIAANPDISPTYRALLLPLAEWFDRRAARPQRRLHGVVEDIDAAQRSVAGVGRKAYPTDPASRDSLPPLEGRV